MHELHIFIVDILNKQSLIMKDINIPPSQPDYCGEMKTQMLLFLNCKIKYFLNKTNEYFIVIE